VRRFAPVFVTLLAGAGCTLITGVGDLEAVDEADASLQPDAVAPRADGGNVGSLDAANDVVGRPIEDAGGDAHDANELPVDAGKDVVVAPPNFCDGVPASVELCLDYDSKSFNQAAAVTNNATISVSGPGHDSNNSLRCVGNDNLQSECYHSVKLPANPGKLRLQFDFLIEEPGLSLELVELVFVYAQGECSMQPTIDQGQVMVNEFCPDQGAPDQINHPIHSLGAGLFTNVWFKFDITLDLTGKTMSGTLTKPTGPVPFGPIILDPRFVTAKDAELHSGMIYAAKHTPGSKSRIDNVTVDVF
jgi:hypothetical protein